MTNEGVSVFFKDGEEEQLNSPRAWVRHHDRYEG